MHFFGALVGVCIRRPERGLAFSFEVSKRNRTYTPNFAVPE